MQFRIRDKIKITYKFLNAVDYFLVEKIEDVDYYIGVYYTEEGTICSGQHFTPEAIPSEIYEILDKFPWEKEEASERKCTCKSLDLFRYGCKCGGS